MKRKGADQGGSGKRWKVQQGKGQIQGQGVLLTTVRRKERKAGLELIEFFEDLVEKLYPDLDLSLIEAVDGEEGDGGGEDYEEKYDLLKNGETSTTTKSDESTNATASTVAIVAAAPKSDTRVDDIEAQIQAELCELKGQKGTQLKSGPPANGDMAEKRARQREKFRLIDPDVECLMFVSVASPMDPVLLSCAMLDQIAKTGHVRGKFIQRLSPIYDTTRAEVDKIGTLADSVMSKHFPKSEEPVTFKIDPRLRLHNLLSKMVIIQTIAPAVPPPHKADLLHPDYMINVEVLKMTIGIGILPRYEEYKRFNPQMIAQRYNESKKGDEDDVQSRSLQKTEKS
ncbi:hypothetical protein CBS101457_005242 [Exobasidium rhododendri]|nr:hypothetical protein CBS101457_005242 [Exobasidium rhododendri]